MNKQGKDKIEYLGYTFNPVTGCKHPCKDTYCYAKTIAKRFGGNAEHEYHGLHILDRPMYKRTKAGKLMVDPYPYGFEPTFHRYRLGELAEKKKPSIIGVVYMGDIAGKWIPQEWFDKVMDTCFDVSRHKYMFLTKDTENLRSLFGNWRYEFGLTGQAFTDFASSLWFGTTVENQHAANKRIPELLNTFGVKKLLSIEPIQGAIDLSRIEPEGHDTFIDALKGTAAVPFTVIENRPKIHWVIIGCQTGPGAVPPKPEWVQSIIDQCRAAGVPVFVKSPLYQQFPIQEWPEGLR